MNEEGQGPAISVIICSYNEAEAIGDTIKSLAAQTWRDFEVILIEDASQDNTLEVITNFLTHAPFAYKILINPHNMGYGESINRGAAHANGHILAFIDAHATAPPDWLAAGQKYSDQADIWGGPFKADLEGLFNKATYAMLGYLTLDGDKGPDQSINLPPGTNLFVKKEVFQQLQGFEPLPAGGDQDLIQKGRRQGWRVLFDPDLYVYHPWNFTPRAYFRRALAFKTSKRSLPSEQWRKYLLALLVIALAILTFAQGIYVGLVILLMIISGTYGYYIKTYLGWGVPFKLAFVCAAIRLGVAFLGTIAYLHLVPHKRFWR
jgi:glycosyltransferase involved in cell wall biosynthesis